MLERQIIREALREYNNNKNKEVVMTNTINNKRKNNNKEATMKKVVTIFTDGSSLGNPGKGGYAAILSYKGHEKVITGCEARTTNNRMELMAVVAALSSLKEPVIVHLYSDSSYVINGINEWLSGWIRKEFKNIKNVDLWQKYIGLAKAHKIVAHKVAGHTGVTLNERCDKLAVAAAKGCGTKKPTTKTQKVSVNRTPNTKKKVVKGYVVVNSVWPENNNMAYCIALSYKNKKAKAFLGPDPRETKDELDSNMRIKNAIILRGIIDGLSNLKEPVELHLYIPSKYVVEFINNNLRNNIIVTNKNPAITYLWHKLVNSLKGTTLVAHYMKQAQDPKLVNEIKDLAATFSSELGLFNNN